MNLKNKEEETRRAQAYYEKKKASQLATVKNTSVILCIVLAVLSLAGGVALLIGTGNIIALGILAVVAAGFGLGALICNLLNKKKRKEIIASIDAACQRCCECIGKICAEYAEYERVYEESDQLAEEIIFAIKR